MTQRIDLNVLTDNGRFHSLSGYDAGQSARARFGLDQHDSSDETVSVAIPEHVFNVAPSFFQGMFAPSVKHFGSAERFLEHYEFDVDPVVMRQVRRGLNACLNTRDAFAA